MQKIAFFITILAVTVFKLWVMNIFPITCDEAYYWLWHKHLALSYVDHPPLIAYFNKLVSFFGEYNLFHFRLAGLILALLATYFVWKTGKVLFNDKAGLMAAALFQLVPHYIIIWLTLMVDNLLAFFWVVSLYFTAKIIKERKPSYWYLLGVSFGLGLLSKYTMIFFLPPLLLLFVLDRELRFWFRRIEPYAGFLLSFLICSPVLAWNIQNNFISPGFHAGRLGRSDFLQNFLSLTADQLVHFTPFLFLGLIIYGKQLWKKSSFLFMFSIPLLIMFYALTSFVKVWAHWVIAYQFAAILGIALMVSDNARTIKRLLVSMWIFDVLAIALILFGSPMLLPRQNIYRENFGLYRRYASIPQDTYIITPYIGSSSQLAFYARRQTYMAQGALKIESDGFGRKQYELWGYPELRKGASIIYYGPANDETWKKLKIYFRKVEERPDLELYVIESYLDDLIPYYCKDFYGKNVIL